MQALDEKGNLDESIKHGLSEDEIKELYHLMTLARAFDEKLFKLQRSGKIGTYASVKGQEAAQVGSSFALRKEDWMVPAFREAAAYLTRGIDRVKFVQAWNGDTRAYYNPGGKDLPVAIPVASQLLTATGIAWASKLQKKDEVTMVYFGDGATSEGDFHEALNFAGVYKLPIIFICQNNQWAISTPRNKQTASSTIAQKAIAYGINGIQVDGNDVIGMYAATKKAVEDAKKGTPTLIEAITFRLGDHTTSDDASKYRNEDEVKSWEEKDPIKRVKLYFEKIGTWTEDYAKWLDEQNKKEVDEAVEKALSIEPRKPQELFDNIFKEMPDELKKQKEYLINEVKND
ncbi:MAG: pyruvate dehydrogenase (acetyl-transferring) E1 component subunit alpha [Candidatus Woesearchaeota archaeon]